MLPTGWSHAFAFCQRVHENILQEGAGLGDSDRLVDGKVPPSLCQGVHVEYVDNCLGFAVTAERASELLSLATESLSGAGLPLHEPM